MTRNRQNTAYHEAGHAVVGAALGRPVTEVTIIAGEDYGGRCTYGDQMKCSDPEFYASDTGRERLWQEAVSGAAGLESEKLFVGTYDPAWGGRDREQGRMLALRAVLSLDELRTLFADRSQMKEMARAHSMSYMDYLADAEEEAGRILQENAEAVHRLAALLLERETVDGASVHAPIPGT